MKRGARRKDRLISAGFACAPLLCSVVSAPPMGPLAGKSAYLSANTHARRGLGEGIETEETKVRGERRAATCSEARRVGLARTHSRGLDCPTNSGCLSVRGGPPSSRHARARCTTTCRRPPY